MKKIITKVLIISVASILLAGTVNAYMSQYWETVKDIVPRTDDEVDLGASTKGISEIWVRRIVATNDLTINAIGGDIDFGDETLTTTGRVGIGIGADTTSPLKIEHSVAMSGNRYTISSQAEIEGAWTTNEFRGLNFDVNDKHSSGGGRYCLWNKWNS